jgi:hypothetical protein
MSEIDLDRLAAHRAETFRTRPGLRLTSKEQAVEYVNQRGFIYFWPIKEILMPSLWVGVAGDRPVADAHDDPGHVSWGWKDSLLNTRQWYYAKILRKRATIISLATVPYFYALSENYGAPEADYLTLYEQGRMTIESRQVFEALLESGPLDAVALRRITRMTSEESSGRFNKALTDLQVNFLILPVGIAEAGAWNYAFIYELVHRYYPELLDQARFISENQARRQLTERYFRSVGAAQLKDIMKLFGWTAQQADKAVNELVDSGLVERALKLELKKGEWIALVELTCR